MFDFPLEIYEYGHMPTETVTEAELVPEPPDEELSADVLALIGIKAKTHFIGLDLPGLRRGSSTRKRLKGGVGEDMHYHVMSRLTGNVPMWDPVEKEAMRLLLLKMAAFCGVDVLTYCVMGNHFHALVRVPDRQQWLEKFQGDSGEERLFEHLHTLYTKSYVKRMQKEIAKLREKGMYEQAGKVIESYLRRFCDVSIWTKEVKERFAKWYNKRHERRGVLWMDRFKCVLVQDGEALRTMGLYIDLNPIRAGIVKDPAEYRWSGYGAAMGGEKEARAGLTVIVEGEKLDWGKVQAVYRTWLFTAGATVERENGEKARMGVDADEAEAVIKAGGKLGMLPMLGFRVRYFSEGLALGSLAWVEEVYGRHRVWFGKKRKVGARQLQGADMWTLRG